MSPPLRSVLTRFFVNWTFSFAALFVLTHFYPDWNWLWIPFLAFFALGLFFTVLTKKAGDMLVDKIEDKLKTNTSEENPQKEK